MQELQNDERPQPPVRDRGVREIKKRANKLNKLQVTYVDIGELKPNSYNPNRQNDFDFDLLLRSITEDGFTQPVVALQDNTIVDGEHRWRAASKLGLKQVPVVHVDMTPEQMRIATLRHNRARGSEDAALSKEVMADLAELGALDWAKDSLKMSAKEINDMLSDLSAAEGLAAEDFSESWVPVKENPEKSSVKMVNITPNYGISSTEKAVEVLQQAEKKIKVATNDSDRELIRKEAQDSIYRISVSFFGEEAEIVKTVLGEKPAEKLLLMVRSELNSELNSEGGAEENE